MPAHRGPPLAQGSVCYKMHVGRCLAGFHRDDLPQRFEREERNLLDRCDGDTRWVGRGPLGVRVGLVCDACGGQKRKNSALCTDCLERLDTLNKDPEFRRYVEGG